MQSSADATVGCAATNSNNADHGAIHGEFLSETEGFSQLRSEQVGRASR